MEYTEEQRAIIQRIGEISAQFDDAAERASTAQAEAAQHTVAALVTAMDSLREIVVLNRRHGDALREFLDTL